MPSRRDLESYLSQQQLQVGVEETNGFQHVYYIYKNSKISVTEGLANNTEPVVSDEYIAWVRTPYGTNQSLLYVHNVLDRTTTQITSFGNASKPDIYGNHLVWEDDSAETASVYFYDGLSVQ
ncbi:MAG: hypothetical protein WC258_05515, partial [Patescibacteria group bacterium]